MVKHERLSAILEKVATEGSISVDDVVALFAVSIATARRDLDDLADQQLVTRTRGGAIAHAVTYDLPLRYTNSRRSQEKRRIAAAAVDLVTDGQVVGLNGGTTNSEVARTLATRGQPSEGTRSGVATTTVVTNALNIATELAVRPRLKILVVGGVLRPQTFELIGPFADHVLDGIAIDIMFLGVGGFAPGHGATAQDEGEAQINRKMVERAAKVVVVADSSKLGQRAFSVICDVAAVDALITDSGADAGLLAQFTRSGVEVLAV